METLVQIAGAVALLIWGLHMTRTGLSRGFAHQLRQAIQRTGGRPLLSFGMGVFIATLLQSSMAVITVAASLSGRKLLSAHAVLVVALGADLGSALAAQLAGHPVGWLSPLLIAIGVVTFEASEQTGRRNLGRAAIGIGLILLSLSLMKAAFAPLAASTILSEVLAALASQPALLLLMAAGMTLLTHSGLAIIAIVATLAAAGVLAPLPGLYMVLGANLGSGVAAVLATRAMPVAIRRGPMANLLIRGAGVASAFLALVVFSPTLPAVEPQILVLAAHLVFNACLALAAMPFIGRIVDMAGRFLPDDVAGKSIALPLHLDHAQLANSELAIGNARREVVRMADTVQAMLGDVALILQSHDASLEKAIALAEDQVDQMHRAVKLYAADFLRHHGQNEGSRQMLLALEFATDLEHIGDIIVHNLLDIAARKNKNGRSFSDHGMQEILDLHNLVMCNMKLAASAFMAGDPNLARSVIAAKQDVRRLVQVSIDAHFSRIIDRSGASLETSGLHVDVLRDFKRINSHLVAVGYRTLERGKAQREAASAVDASR